MDFGTLLHVAKKNSENKKNEGKYYSTKFAPPKKESKEKKLSENIQKFLQKREQEEKARQREEKDKLTNLLAMRDEKSKNKIKKMLKVTKSANKSVLDDAVNTEHTAVTMEGPEQPDQDDYGYVSTEANAFYQKYIDKVKDVKEDKGFAPSRPQSLKDLSGTKERVKAAITRENDEKKSHTRQRTITSNTSSATSSKESIARSYSTLSKPLYDPDAERREEERKKREDEQKRAKARKPLPPIMDFQALLKLAEKKQHEPIDILPEIKKKKEPERLLTSKEKRELDERLKEREARERRRKERNDEPTKDRRESCTTQRMEPNGRIPKLNQSAKPATSVPSVASSKSKLKTNGTDVGNAMKKSTIVPSTTTSSTLPSSKNMPHSAFQSSTKARASSPPSVLKTSTVVKPSTSSKNPYGSVNSKNPYSGPTRDFPPRDVKSKQLPTTDRQKTRQFPPSDVRKGPSGRPGGDRKINAKRRINDDDDDEYDSELDDFIDDGDDEEDYSSHIKAIFGYDKSRYRHLDDEDDTAMESNFAQVQREEYISKKLGLQEDLEDMKQEAIDKKRKMAKKRRA